MQGTVKVLNGSGHSTIEFDTEAGVVEEAERFLATANSTGSSFFDGVTRERIGAPGDGPPKLGEHEQIIVVPQMSGG
jgi:hypothetical protein